MHRRTLISFLGASVLCPCHGTALALDHDQVDIPCALNISSSDGTSEMPRGFLPWSPARDGVDATSGNANLDSALGVLLVHMSRFFGVQPQFGFIWEEQGPNAFATAYNANNFVDGTVAFGRELLDIEISKANGDFAVMAICAHEFGHIRQYRDRYIPRIEANLPGYCVELQADFAAGAFVAYWRRMMRPEHLLRIGDTWAGLGSTDFNNPGSHGTSVQRVRAIEAGFFYRDGVRNATVTDVMEAGYRHVSQYG